MWRKIRRNLIAGILVLLPLYFTWVILVWLFLMIDGIFNRVATRALVSALKLPISEDQIIYGLGVITLLAVVFITGWLARNYFGNRLLRWFNHWLDRIPIVKTVYRTLRQLSEAILSSGGDAFQKPVLIEYPRKGLFTLVFKTGNTQGPVKNAIGEECISVFLPSTPNPTTGYILFVPISDVHEVEMNTQDALKLIISGGVINPDKKCELTRNSRQTVASNNPPDEGSSG
ncbi:hypothetical protein CEE37_04500 [candidate division LCP-89 bacterium B3_LCP]|uniref:DUF502 domain-containing protein n=1 Tax=candidate division LCP-89 bacterium B3_LCP TaxID=2012998 RepID=A0A532V3Q3_UNCL8|nr:MAG: hypothetical protein CEE37_04500 [candidate division LCP-89 bacterium B3_LCP]